MVWSRAIHADGRSCGQGGVGYGDAVLPGKHGAVARCVAAANSAEGVQRRGGPAIVRLAVSDGVMPKFGGDAPGGAGSGIVGCGGRAGAAMEVVVRGGRSALAVG